MKRTYKKIDEELINFTFSCGIDVLEMIQEIMDEKTRRINDVRKKVDDALKSIEDRLSPEQIIIILQDCLKKYQQMKKTFGEFVNKTKERKLRVYDYEDEEMRRISLKLDNDARKKVVDALESIEDRLSIEQIIIILQDCLKNYKQMKKSLAYLDVPYDHDKDIENQKNMVNLIHLNARKT